MSQAYIPLDKIAVSAISVAVPSLPSDAGPGLIQQQLYELGLCVLVNVSGHITALFNGVTLADSEPVFCPLPLQALPYNSQIIRARKIFEQTDLDFIPLVFENKVYTGFCASREAWLKRDSGQLAIPKIGGLATPLGVYLTTGVHASGAGYLGLLLTGLYFAGSVLFIQVILHLFPYPFYQHPFWEVLAILLGLLLMVRFSPLSGLHSAEHQVIQAIEKGLPLTIESITKQTRTYSSCGTNFMVCFTGIVMAYLGASQMVNVILAVVFLIVGLAAFAFAGHRLGMLVQTCFTTSFPSNDQLEQALSAGQELLEKFRLQPHEDPPFLQRIWHSGLLQVLLSFAVVSWLLQTCVAYLQSG